jgi:hypothetical protein
MSMKIIDSVIIGLAFLVAGFADVDELKLTQVSRVYLIFADPSVRVGDFILWSR